MTALNTTHPKPKKTDKSRKDRDDDSSPLPKPEGRKAHGVDPDELDPHRTGPGT